MIRRKLIKVGLIGLQIQPLPLCATKRSKFVRLPSLLTSSLGKELRAINLQLVFYPYLELRRPFPKGIDSTPPFPYVKKCSVLVTLWSMPCLLHCTLVRQTDFFRFQ